MLRKYFIILAFSAIISVLSPPLVSGDDYYITHTGSGSSDGSSWANAGNSIQDGINGVGAGDTLYIGGGTYRLTSRLYSTRSGNASNRIVWTVSDHPTHGGAVTIDLNSSVKEAF